MRLRVCTSFLMKINKFPSNLVNSLQPFSVSISRNFSQWDIVGAVCLERKPIITQSLTPFEQKYWNYLQKLEVEKSLLSDHEKRISEDKRLAEKLKSGVLEDSEAISQQTAQDFEDACAEELAKYTPGSRITDADTNNDRHSSERKLDLSLVFVIKQKLGNDFKWVLPQAVHEKGETLRQTAERALKDVASFGCKVRFMGNAPVGFYKYKYPKVVRGNGICGAKVFFFKAQLFGAKAELSLKASDSVTDYLWLTHSELPEVFQPVYCKTVQSFLYPDTLHLDDKDFSHFSFEEEEKTPSVMAGQA